MNRIIRISVNESTMKNLWETAGASESGNAVTLRLSFSEHWDNTGKTAMFTDALGETSVAVPILSGGDTVVVEDEEVTTNDIEVPAEAMKYPGTATFTIVGVEVDGETVKRRLTTRAAHLRVMESGVPETLANAVPMTATDKEQILAAVSQWSEGEQSRTAAESAREAAEADRQANEENRVSSEEGRVAAESERDAAELARESAESGRVSAEAVRAEHETVRQASEAGRVSAEAARETAELAREAAEQDRADENTGIVARATAKAEDAASSEAAAALSAGSASASKEAAAQSAASAAADASDAMIAKNAAKLSETAAAESEMEAKSWAVGGTGVREGENTNNAKYYAEQAAEIVGGDFATRTEAQQYASSAQAAAIAAAESDAAEKVSAAVTTAAADATSKANAAQAAAIAASEAKIAKKQDILIPGQNISIELNEQGKPVISARAGLELASIAVTTEPTKINYYAGESFDATGMVVTGDYGHGITYPVTGYTVSPAGALDAGTDHVTITYTENGVTKEATQAITTVKRTLAVPQQDGSLTYTGNPQAPQWTGYDSATMDKEETARTDAGSSDTRFSLKRPDLYQWEGGSTEDQVISWSIAKAAGSVTLTPAALTLNVDARTGSFSVSRSGDGAISVSSSDTSVATASLNGDTVSVSSVNDNTGTATINVNVAEGTNYLAASAACQVTAQFISVYGVEWDGSQTTQWTRTDDASGFYDPVPYMSGMTAEQCSSPFDGKMPWSGMVKTNRTGGVMVAIPKFWYRLTVNGNGLKIQIADGQKEGFSVSPAHMDRGDGKGERDVVYIGRYHCHASNYKSQTGGQPRKNTTRGNFRTSIHAMGDTIWQCDWLTRFSIFLLYFVEYADWNSQATIGKGCSDSGSIMNMGYTDSMPYHTGTTQSNRDTYGGTQYRNIEGLWDNVYDWCDGCYYNSSGMNIIKNPANFASGDSQSGGVCIGMPTGGWPKKFTVSDAAGTPLFYPTEAGGSETTYSCDDWYFSTSSPCLFVGGNYGQGGSHGLFCVNYGSASGTFASIGSRLQELP